MKHGIFPDWEEFYKEKRFEAMPWFHPVLDPDLDRALKDLRIDSGKALDLGTGPGTQAMALAERGFEVTATDISITAVRKAASIAAEKGLAIDFRQDDILDSTLSVQFDLVFDRGCLNVLAAQKRPDYLAAMERLIKPGGFLFLKAISRIQGVQEGPHHFTPAEIKGLFSRSFALISVEGSVMQGTIVPPPMVYFCVLKRL